ncbi:MAG: chemotaxis response regulator protein-glutamate methylesterase [Treponema sp.]|nr:chemotaxis response regulator protein-glutamate methylesterase [Treponema sp.]
MDDEISVLIVDDSALMRNLIGRMIEDTPGLVVADKAMNGKFALDKIPRCKPDIICLDLEMPEMNGIEFLKERRRCGIKIPVVILSSIAARGAVITMEALALGASDFIQKPSGSISDDIHTVKDNLTSMLLGYGGQYRRLQGLKLRQADYTQKPPSLSVHLSTHTDTAQTPHVRSADGLPIPPSGTAKRPTPLRKPGKTDIIAIGISTGGPDALRVVFSKLDADLKVPIVVVQHMPPGFTMEFARSLDRVCPLEVKEAAEGDEVSPGRILIAQGNKHMEVEKRAYGSVVHLTDAPAVSGHRPSVDVLFASIAKFYGNHSLGVIMTGMGRDGAEQIGEIYKEGGLTIGQDEASAIVYGMPRVAFELGHIQEQVSLQNMARRICDIAKTPR